MLINNTCINPPKLFLTSPGRKYSATVKKKPVITTLYTREVVKLAVVILREKLAKLLKENSIYSTNVRPTNTPTFK